MPFAIRNALVSRHLASLSLSVAISSLYFSGALFGQTLGEITGEVRDTTGAVIVGAAIQITNEAGQALHILDRFHITGHLNKAVDEVRRAESTRLRAKIFDAFEEDGSRFVGSRRSNRPSR